MSSVLINLDVSALNLNQVYEFLFNNNSSVQTIIRPRSIPGGPKPILVIHNHSGNFLQFNIAGSNRNFCIQANGLTDPVELADEDTAISYQPYAQAAGYPSAWAPNMLMLVFYSAGEKPVTVGNGAGFNVPAATLGPGALPDTVAIGTAPGIVPQSTNSPLPNDERVGVELFGAGVNGDAGVYGGASAAILSSRGAGDFIKFNNYYDGTHDRFIVGNQLATQLWSDINGLHMRVDNGMNRVAGGTITWNSDFFDMDTGGNSSFVGAMTIFANLALNVGLNNALQWGVPTHYSQLNGDQGGSLELGSHNNIAPGAAITPYIDFHSSNNARDFDSRISASGGGASDGLGALNFSSAFATFGGQVQDTGGTQYGRMGSKGGGAAGFLIWEGTTDPAASAVEGDLWVDK